MHGYQKLPMNVEVAIQHINEMQRAPLLPSLSEDCPNNLEAEGGYLNSLETSRIHIHLHCALSYIFTKLNKAIVSHGGCIVG